MADPNRPARRRRLIASALAALAVAALPVVLFARAGGGHSYSGSHSSGHGGGGGGGGGGSGGGDGLFDLIFYLLRLCFYYPKVGVPILIVVVAFLVYTWRTGADRYQSSVIRRGRAARDRAQVGLFEAVIRTGDPAFAAAAFADRVSAAFLKIQEAWSRQDLSAVRPFISDGVHERFSLQFDEQRFLGYRNRTSDVSVESVTLTGARTDAHFDHLDVRIIASAVDQDVRLADGQVLRGSAMPQAFSEVWSFLRRRGVTTRPGAPGLMEGNCPNCGGAIEMNQNANCRYCGALLRSGQYDWVLVEITQECEWQPHARQTPPGAAALAGRDPGFNVQELEDKASVVFWRKATAERVGSVDPLRKAALPTFCERYERELRQRRDGGEHGYYGECAVGSVDVRGILTAADHDRALVEVRWSGTRFTLAPGGRPQRHEHSGVFRMLLVLARRAGAVSNPDRSISSAHCPTCGAPESGGTSGTCDSCGATLNDGSTTWALEEAVDFADPRAREWLGRLGDQPGDRQAPAPAGSPDGQPSAANMLAWMVKTSLGDGHLDDRERALLESVAARHRVPPQRLEALIAAARSGTLDVPEPATRDEARGNLRAIALAALADGKLTPAENALLRSAGRRLGLSDYDIGQLLRGARRELYADARQHLRAARNGGPGNGNGRP